MMHTDSTNVKFQSGSGPAGRSPSKKSAQSEATQRKLLRAARRLFAKHGYAKVGTEEIVRAAGVTRGALYHQFADKRELFAAVFEETEAELIAESARRAADAKDPVEALRSGFLGWLDACSEPGTQRIVLVDAPAVLGWEEWRTIGERLGLGVTMAALQAGMGAGAPAPQPGRPPPPPGGRAGDGGAPFIPRAREQEEARAGEAPKL